MSNSYDVFGREVCSVTGRTYVMLSFDSFTSAALYTYTMWKEYRFYPCYENACSVFVWEDDYNKIMEDKESIRKWQMHKET